MIANTSVHAAGERRRALNDTMAELESAVAAASGAYWWRERVEDALASLGDALEAHIKEVEAPDGLLHQIVDEAPRLSGAVEQMRTDHRTLQDSVARLWSTVSAPADSDGITEIRRRVTVLLGRLTVHRQQGSDLIYDAYNIDIGAAD
jgi:prophage DNA circulation protein